MRFERYGRTYQLQIEGAEGLKDVLTLDESHWAAASAPTSVFHCDAAFLDMIDTDHNGRIYTREIKEAITWLLDRLSDTSRIAEGDDSLAFSLVREDTPEGEALLSSAGYMLEKQGIMEPGGISLEEVRSFVASIKDRPLNGDGVIVADAASDPETKQLIDDVIACGLNAEDVGGRKGITEENIDRFSKAIPQYLEWKEAGYIPEGAAESAIMPFGPETDEMYRVLSEHSAKIDTFFALCRLIRFDPEWAKAFAGLAPESVEPTSESVAKYLDDAKIAKSNAEGVLDLAWDAVNPSYRKWLESLIEKVLAPVLGRKPTVLAEGDWREVKARLEPYAAYMNSKKGSEVERLPEDRLELYADGALFRKALALCRADREVCIVLEGLRELERLILYHKHLIPLVNNFVSFPHLYSADERALFEMGSAVIDERWFDFAVRVDDIKVHSAMAKLSNIFIIYLEVGKNDTDKKFTVAVPATFGSKGNLAVGKRGVFFDRGGEEYDARIVQIIENPISLREAIVAPFLSLWRMAEGKIEKWSTSSEKELQSKLDKLTAAPSGGIAGGPAGLLMGGGVVLAALGAAFAFIAKTLAELSPGQVIFGLFAAAAAVLLPLTLIAVKKLRRQDLSALLEGCGWAVNVRMGLDRTQRRHFTREVPYPEDADGTPRSTWFFWVLLATLMILLAYGAYYISKTYMSPPSAPTADSEAIAE